MDSDDDVLLPSSQVGASTPTRQRKLKRLRKAITVTQDLQLDRSESDDLGTAATSPELKALEIGESEEKHLLPSLGSEGFGGGSGLDSGVSGPIGDEEGCKVNRAWYFEGFDEKLDETSEDKSNGVREENKEEFWQKPQSSGHANGEIGLVTGFPSLVGDGECFGVMRVLDFEGLAGKFDESIDDESNGIRDESEDTGLGEPEEEQLSPSGIDVENGLDSDFTGLVGHEESFGVKRALYFEVLAGEVGENGEDDIREENKRLRSEELDEEQQSPGRVEGEKDRKKKKRKKMSHSGHDDDNTTSEPSLNNPRSGKERRDHMKQLHAESQRLLRETRDATFKPLPFVQKPISSVLEKIRQRKLELLSKSVAIGQSYVVDDSDGDDELLRDVVVNHNTKVTGVDDEGNNIVLEKPNKETIGNPPQSYDNIVDELTRDNSNDGITHQCQKVSELVVDEAPKQEFRAPIDDTQDLFSSSQTSDSQNETPSSPLGEVFISSVLPLNLQLDSVPPDDDSSDEENYDKENVDPCPRGAANLSLSPNGDPVKAFVEDEAEEEDDSDNDLLRFKENDEEDDDADDLEELKEMIATGYKEKPIDNERRNKLHQKWLEQQDEAGTENLLQKLKYGSKVKEPSFMEEEEEDGIEEDKESGDEVADEMAPSNLVKMNLKKVKQMMSHMFTDKNDGYLSSDDEEQEKKFAKQCLLGKAEEHVNFSSPAEDESSKDIFGRIKKLNVAPDSKKRAKTQTYFQMSLMGINRSISSKPSFLGLGSSHSLPSSKKQGSKASRSFIFEREDSNSKSAISVSEDSSEPIEPESRTKTVSAKFVSSQMRISRQSPSPATNSDTSLLELLKRNSFASKRCTVDSMGVQTESILSSFKLTKKSLKSKGGPSL